LAGASRFASLHVPLTAGAADDSRLLRAAIADVVAAQQVDIVLPVTDRASRALLGAENEIGARVAGPTRSAYLSASDKAALLAVASNCGIRVPRQDLLPNRETALPPSVGQGWTVVKPSQSVVDVDGALVSTTVRYAFGHEALGALVASYPAAAYPLMLQERIVGAGEGVFLLRQQGRTHLVFAHRRLREKPPSGGVSTYRESIAPPAELVARCEVLLDELGYEGAAMVEFKRDSATGEHVLMEINARLWGSVQLAIDAGIDFPSALVQSALGVPITVQTEGRVGVRSVWELGELDHLWALLRRSPDALQLPAGQAAGIPAVLRALFDRRIGDHPEVFRWKDPMPFVAELSKWVRGR
jgi:biotin carboxylase